MAFGDARLRRSFGVFTAAGFRGVWMRNTARMSDSTQRQLAMLTMLHSVCEQAIIAFHAADNRVDDGLVSDLERMVERTRVEIEALNRSGS